MHTACACTTARDVSQCDTCGYVRVDVAVNGLMPPDAVADLIGAGRRLLLAGDETLLAGLPRGSWIGGTMSTFMVDGQIVTSCDRLFVTELPPEATSIAIRSYDTETLPRIAAAAPANGFTVLLIPAFSPLHTAYAEGVFRFEGIFNRPLVGWITGVAPEEVGKRAPKVFDGTSGAVSDRLAVAAHVSLPSDLTARTHIANPFRPGDGPVLGFEEEGFAARRCTVDGQPMDFVRYIREHGIDPKLPLVADCFGTPVNVSIRAVDDAMGEVRFYAPVFPHLRYRFADPLAPAELAGPPGGTVPAFACNCIKNTGHAPAIAVAGLAGPMTFGEIAYVLLNQTLVYLTVEPVATATASHAA